MQKLESVSNEKVKLAVKIASSVKARREKNMFFLEGLRLCRDALDDGTEIYYSFFTQKAFDKYSDDLGRIAEKSDEAYLISDSIAEKISLTESSQGVYCLCKCKNIQTVEQVCPKGKYIALENIQDPSNLGAVCRTAEALGISGVILSGCCDVYNPKSQRAAMGSLLRVPLFECDNLSEGLVYLKNKGMKLYATSPDSSSEKITEVSMTEGVVSVIGNEGNGVTDEIFALCEKVTIPMLGNAESLNASMAAAIVMWEMMR